MADEYIRKADAIKQCGFGMTSLHIADNLRKMPPADVVPVIRCRDCDCHGTCTHEQYLGMDGFCSHGERKNDVPTNIIESLKEEINTVNRLNDRIKNRGNNG